MIHVCINNTMDDSREKTGKPKLLGFGGDSNTFGGARNLKRKSNGQFTKQSKKKKKGPSHPSPKITPVLAQVEGTRLIDLGHLQKQLICKKCSSELSIRALCDETHLGLASVLTVHSVPIVRLQTKFRLQNRIQMETTM